MKTNIYSFEHGMDFKFDCSNSSIGLSNKHFKDGESSLCWEINGRSSLEMNTPIGYEPFKEGSLDQARDSFVIWIYSEEEHPGENLRFDFLKNGDSCAYFLFHLDFIGWRTAWVPYDSMEGQAISGMDGLRITASMEESCTLYIDQMIVCVPIDPRHHTRDKQVPFVNVQADYAANSHWLSLYRFDSLKEKALVTMSADTVHVDTVPIEDIQAISKRFEEYILSFSPYRTNRNFLSVDSIVTAYEDFNIRETAGHIIGITINAACHTAAFPKTHRETLISLTNAIDIKDCGKWMLDVAYAWHGGNTKQKEELGILFINLFRHLLDQGWAYGSSMGTTHHLGYPMRAYYWSIFLMREVLKEAGYLQQASKAMAWFSGCGRIFREEHEMKSESMDTLNTLLQGILGSILTIDKIEELNLCLKAMQRWLSTCMKPAPGLSGPFKVDGSSFHHCNHYPAYAMGGFTGAAPVVYFLSRTAYEIGEDAHKTMKKSLLSMRLYCNTFNWLVGMSARHPRGTGEMSQISTLEPFYYMALSGTPGGTDKVDKEMAGALLRFSKCSNYPKAKIFADMGYEPESNPTGHFTMNYACTAVHRRDHWLAGVRGHSRYIWGNETYLANNLYGRYIAYGNLQILGGGSPVNNKDSGFYQEGWDWNCWPGTTAVHLPLEELKANVCNVDKLSGFEEMLISDETFAGGTSINGRNGMFAMKLHGHGKYDSSHRARKSYFFFDNRIICIGTGIENSNHKHETRTTLFQNYLSKETDPICINTEPIVGLDTDVAVENTPLWLKDNVGNSYYIPRGQRIKITRSMQESRDQGSNAPTSAPFAKAWIDHGTAPCNESYEYLIVVNHKESQDVHLMNSYQVLQANNNAHILRDVESETLAYAFYESCENLLYGKVQGIERPALVMEQIIEETLHLSICDPDLRLYEGVEEDQISPEGIQKEVSLYSRKWRKSPSIGKNLNVTLKGHWNMISPVEGVSINYDNGNTIVTAFCKEAQPIEIRLKG